jgi:hypothetical protein
MEHITSWALAIATTIHNSITGQVPRIQVAATNDDGHVPHTRSCQKLQLALREESVHILRRVHAHVFINLGTNGSLSDAARELRRGHASPSQDLKGDEESLRQRVATGGRFHDA